jgi:hypothetical protein
VRGLARRLRSNFGIRSARMSIRSQMAWQWRWLLNVLVMVLVATVVWWLVENSYRITGFNRDEARQRMGALVEENRILKRDHEATKAALIERDRQLQIDRASQSELARNVAQLQEENAALKEDLGFLRNIMSSGATPEGVGVSNLKVEPDAKPNQFRYRMLLTQGGQRKQDFKGRLQVVVRAQQAGNVTTFTFPDVLRGRNRERRRLPLLPEGRGAFRLPEDATLRSVEVRVLAAPGGQVKLSRTLNFP